MAIRPFRTYELLGSDAPNSARTALWGAALWLGMVACFVSWTTSGALLIEHLLLNPIACLFAPAFQIGWLWIATRVVGRDDLWRVVGLYYKGHLPWWGLLMVVSGAVLFIPEPGALMVGLVRYGVLFVLILGVMIWCGVLTYAQFRAGLGLSRRRSSAATAVFYGGYTLTLVGWFLFTGQLLPLWWIF